MADGLTATYAEFGVRDGGSPVPTVDLETASVARIYKVDWDDMQQAIAQLLGYSSLDGDGKLTRHLPERDPDFIGLWASRVSQAQGIVWDSKETQTHGSTNVFKLAAIHVDFQPRPYWVLSDAAVSTTDPETEEVTTNEFLRFVEVVASIEGDYLSMDDGTIGVMHYSEGPNGFPTVGDARSKFPSTTGKIICAENYTFVWHSIPDAGIPEDTILDTVGCVNKTDFGDLSTPRLTFPAGNLLLLGASWRRIHMWTPSGVTPAWTITYMAKYKDFGHNRVFDWHLGSRQFVRISVNGTDYPPGSVPDGKCIYNEREFALLFDVTAG